MIEDRRDIIFCLLRSILITSNMPHTVAAFTSFDQLRNLLQNTKYYYLLRTTEMSIYQLIFLAFFSLAPLYVCQQLSKIGDIKELIRGRNS
jgi:hypothetical protein